MGEHGEFFSTNFSFFTFLLSFSYQIRAPPTELKLLFQL